MMKLTAWSADQLLQNELPPDCALIRFADHHDMLTPYKGEPADKLDVICMDVEDMPTLNSPNIVNTKQIYDFVIRNQRRANMIAQCMAGIGRSRAVIAAVGKATGNDVRPILRMGTHNRSLYRKLLAHFGLAPDPEPRVFLAVRVKYAVDRLHAMILSWQRQRYD